MALPTGRIIGNYRIVRQIGEGAFGEVYLVENPLIERRAAVKVLRPILALDTDLVRRFFNEARAASAIRHPSIIEVYDAGGTPEGAPYILMEFLEGTSLKKRLTEVGRLALPQVLEIACQTGSALAAAHAVEIVHRDLKPENLFLVPDVSVPGGERVKILDFGIAKVRHSCGAVGSLRTETGLIMGSPTYMSPEQCKDSADVDLRADIYSFATILYEMLAGRPPHVATTGLELLLMHLSEKPRPLRELVPEIPEHVDAAIMRALGRERNTRFEGFPAFLRALRGEADSCQRDSWSAEAGGEGGASPASRPKAHPPATTLTAAQGQVIAQSGDRTDYQARTFWRWLALVFAGLVVAGIVLFLLARRITDGSPPMAEGAASVLTGSIGPVPAHPSPPEIGAQVIVVGAVDGGASSSEKLAIPHAAPVPTSSASLGLAKRQQATPPTMIGKLQRTAKVSTRPKDNTPPSTQPIQDDVTGF